MALCLCGICIPYSAVFALLAVIFKPIVMILIQLGLIPSWLARKFGIYTTTTTPTSNNDNCCKKDMMDKNDKKTNILISSIQSKEHFHSIVSTYSKVIIKFTASWCKPCKNIHPLYEQLALEYSTITPEEKNKIHFCIVDVDEVEDVGSICNVSAMPTFIFFHQGQKISSIQGANEMKLKSFVSQSSL
jgi:thioredoxin 1